MKKHIDISTQIVYNSIMSTQFVYGLNFGGMYGN